MRKRMITLLMILGSIAAVPTMTLAKDDEETVKVDARLEGYKEGSAALKDGSGTALTWLLLIVLSGICVGVMFINSKRTHLD